MPQDHISEIVLQKDPSLIEKTITLLDNELKKTINFVPQKWQ